MEHAGMNKLLAGCVLAAMAAVSAVAQDAALDVAPFSASLAGHWILDDNQGFGSLSGGTSLRTPALKGSMKYVRIYNRNLRTSEAVGNFKTGCPATAARK